MKIEEEINYLKTLILHMADTVSSNLDEAFDAYLNYDENKEYTTINDNIVDQQERSIEEECLSILLKERLYASDLRVVTGILKLVEDLERLGDHAEDILEFSLRLKNVEKHHNDKIKNVSEFAKNMVKKAIDSFIKNDIVLASEVIKDDDYMDKTYQELINEMIDKSNDKKVSSAFAIYTTLVIKYIERIADHAVNVAEWVIYINNGYHKDKQIF